MACCGRDAAANVYVPEQASSTDHDVQHWDTSSSGIADVGAVSGAQSSEDANRSYSWDLVIVMPYEKDSSVRGSRDALVEADADENADGAESSERVPVQLGQDPQNLQLSKYEGPDSFDTSYKFSRYFYVT